MGFLFARAGYESWVGMTTPLPTLNCSTMKSAVGVIFTPTIHTKTPSALSCFVLPLLSSM